MAAKGRRKQVEEEHENHERWMVSYADMMTLLMVLFLILFAISTVDQRKFEELRNGLASGFGAPISAVQGGKGPLEETGTSPQAADLAVPALRPQMGVGEDKKTASVSEAAVEAAEKRRLDAERAAVQREVRDLEETRKRLEEALRKRNLQGAARFRIDERGLVVSIVTDKVVFPADRAELAPDGRHILDAFAPVLQSVPNRLIIEGHTNTVKVAPKYFPSEWELSTARASAVVRYLTEQHGFSPGRMEASGFADQRPLYPASDPQANMLNRRVEVVLVSTLNTGLKGTRAMPQ
jgi:chemotaxis protein MotB